VYDGHGAGFDKLFPSLISDQYAAISGNTNVRMKLARLWRKKMKTYGVGGMRYDGGL